MSVYQVYNKQSRTWVKMQSGKILDNAAEKFEGIPVKEKEEPNDPPPAVEPDKPDSDKDSSWFF